MLWRHASVQMTGPALEPRQALVRCRVAWPHVEYRAEHADGGVAMATARFDVGQRRERLRVERLFFNPALGQARGLADIARGARERERFLQALPA